LSNLKEFNISSILITGGTGSFGRSFLLSCLNSDKYSRIVVYSRDELKQHDMRQDFDNDDRIRWFLGDVRDLERLKLALAGVEYVVHAAALKQVDTAEYNPMEFVKTNVIGSQNVIEASIYAGVKKVVALSTDKASSPINLYGATKLTADKLFVAGNIYGRPQGTIFSVVRYGNVVNSRGSVVPYFRKLLQQGRPLEVTDQSMTRFWLKLDVAVKLVLNALEDMRGGELYVPQIPSVKIMDVVKALSPKGEYVFTGIRPGEKLHEEMISTEEARRAEKRGNIFVLHSSTSELTNKKPTFNLPEGFRYSSDTNSDWLSIEEIKKTIQ
jgi:UDP-N-acetylglucosamine 4,6-dehydratase